MSSRNSWIWLSASSRQSMPSRVGPFQQWVVDVGDVLHVVHAATAVQPHPLHQIEGQVGGRMAEMCCVIRGDAADVDRGRLPRRGGTDHVGGRVVQPERPGRARQRRDVR